MVAHAGDANWRIMMSINDSYCDLCGSLASHAKTFYYDKFSYTYIVCIKHLYMAKPEKSKLPKDKQNRILLVGM